MQTVKMLVLLLLLPPTMAGCALSGTTPVAVSCPPPPPVPQVLMDPIDTAPNMSQRIETLLQDFEQRVTKARGTQ